MIVLLILINSKTKLNTSFYFIIRNKSVEIQCKSFASFLNIRFIKIILLFMLYVVIISLSV